MNAVEQGQIDFLASPLSKFRPWVAPNGASPQRDFLAAAATHPVRVYRGGNRTGKGVRVDEPVLTPCGWTTIGQLRQGDRVITGDGTAAPVLGIFNRGVRDTFRLTFNDGTQVVCDEDHRWLVNTRLERFPRPGKVAGPPVVMDLHEIRSRWGDKPAPVSRVSIPLVKPVHFDAIPLGLDPYLLGVALGDGSVTPGGTTLHKTEEDRAIFDRIASRAPSALVSVIFREPRGDGATKVSATARLSVGAHAALVALGLEGRDSHEKFIPWAFKHGTPDERLEVLRGLCDTDGHCGDGGHVEYSTTSEALANDVRDIVWSLGGKCTIRRRVTFYPYKGERRQGRESFRVSVRIPGLNPFTLERKAARYDTAIGWTYDRVLVSIEPAGPAECVCIAVDHPSETYVIHDFVVTHNTTVGNVDTLLRCAGWHPFTRHIGPQIGWCVVPSWEQVALVNWPNMKRWIPTSLVKGFAWQRKSAPEIPQAIIFKNGGELHFRSAEAGREKMQGAKLHFAMIDEELDGGVVEEVRARLLDTGGDLFCTLTPLARKEWVRAIERESTTHVVRANMRDAAKAGIIDGAAVERFLSTLPERQRRVRERGDLVALEGLVYPEFDRNVHVLRPRGNFLVNGNGQPIQPWPIPKPWPRYGAVDFGYANPFACPTLARSPWDESLIVEQLLYRSGIRITRWAEIMKATLPTLVTPLAADHDAGERAELDAAGIPSFPAIKDVVNGLEEVERRLHVKPNGKPGLYFVVHDDERAAPHHGEVGRIDAERMAWEMDGYRYPERKEGVPLKDVPVKVDDHAMDALRYAAMLVAQGDTMGFWGSSSKDEQPQGRPEDPMRENRRPTNPLGDSLLGGGLGF